jgi:hypothetical protein
MNIGVYYCIHAGASIFLVEFKIVFEFVCFLKKWKKTFSFPFLLFLFPCAAQLAKFGRTPLSSVVRSPLPIHAPHLASLSGPAQPRSRPAGRYR